MATVAAVTKGSGWPIRKPENQSQTQLQKIPAGQSSLTLNRSISL